MSTTFNSVARTYSATNLGTTATLALAADALARAGVLIANNNASGGADIHVVVQDDFSTPPTMTNPSFKVSPGNSVQISAGKGVAVWVAASTGSATAIRVSEVVS